MSKKSKTVEVEKVETNPVEVEAVEIVKPTEKVKTVKVDKPEIKSEEVHQGPAQVYVGPSLLNIVRSNTVFTNGLPSNLQKVVDDNPFMKSLLVNLDDYADALKEVNIEGSALNTIYNKANKI